MNGSTCLASLLEKIIVDAVDAVVKASGCGGGVKTGFCNKLALFLPEKIIVGTVDAAVMTSGCGGGVKIGFCNKPGLFLPEKIIVGTVDAAVMTSGCGGGMETGFCSNPGSVSCGAFGGFVIRMVGSSSGDETGTADSCDAAAVARASIITVDSLSGAEMWAASSVGALAVCSITPQ